MQITMNIPFNYDPARGEQELAADIRLNNALMLYRQGRVSQGRAALLAGVPLPTFVYECGRNDITLIRYAAADLDRETAAVAERLA
jgi:predicted HTH domain antitoxin